MAKEVFWKRNCTLERRFQRKSDTEMNECYLEGPKSGSKGSGKHLEKSQFVMCIRPGRNKRRGKQVPESKGVQVLERK